jgi:hypothetical protein
MTLPSTRRARDAGRDRPVPVTSWATDRNPLRSDVRAPPLALPGRLRRCLRPTRDVLTPQRRRRQS